MTEPGSPRSLLAIGGGAGGVGKSLLALNLATYLAQLGRRVALVDADSVGARLHTQLGLSDAVTEVARGGAAELLARQTTIVPGLVLLPQLYERGSTSPLRARRRSAWARRLRTLDVDYVIVDVGAGTQPGTLDLWLGADLGVCVTTPTPASVEATYRFARALFLRKLQRGVVDDAFKQRVLERVLGQLGPLPRPPAVIAGLARLDVQLAARAASKLARLRPRLVVNEARARSDAELGRAMAECAERHLGIAFEAVGDIDFDEAVHQSALARRPLLVESPTSKAGRSLERVARRLLTHAARGEPEAELEAPAVLERPEPTLYDLLRTHRGATDEELRRAYKRQREIVRPGSLPLASLLTDAEVEREALRLEEAHDTLLEPLRRQAYDLTAFCDEPTASSATANVTDEALEAEREALRRELTEELHDETQYTGALLRRVREAAGLSAEDVAKKTRISLRYVVALEEDDLASLPTAVYARGFLRVVARELRLDEAAVARTYFARSSGRS